MFTNIIGLTSYKSNTPILSNTMLIKTIKETIPRQTLLFLEKTSQPASLYFAMSLILFLMGTFLIVKGVRWFTISFLSSFALLYVMILSDFINFKLQDGTLLTGYQPFGIDINEIFVDNPNVFYISAAAIFIGLLFLAYFVRNSLPYILSFFAAVAIFSENEMKTLFNDWGLSNMVKLICFLGFVLVLSVLFKTLVNIAFITFYSIFGALYVTSGILNVLIWSNGVLGFAFPDFEAFSAMNIFIHAIYVGLVFFGVYKQMIVK